MFVFHTDLRCNILIVSYNSASFFLPVLFPVMFDDSPKAKQIFIWSYKIYNNRDKRICKRIQVKTDSWPSWQSIFYGNRCFEPWKRYHVLLCDILTKKLASALWTKLLSFYSLDGKGSKKLPILKKKNEIRLSMNFGKHQSEYTELRQEKHDVVSRFDIEALVIVWYVLKRI